MIRECFINKINEISFNVTQSKIDSIRKKSITKSGCRVYENGYIGVSGTLGEITEETWNEAIKNLENKVPYTVEPECNRKMTRDLRDENLSDNEFLSKSEQLLEILRDEFSDFIFSNKIKAIESETILKNDLGLEYVNIDKTYMLELIVKECDSINIMDTGIMYLERNFNMDDILKEVRQCLSAYRNLVELPKVDKLPVINYFNNVGRKVIESLSAKNIKKGISIFSDKMDKDIFSKDFSLYIDRSKDNIGSIFFDAEGNVLEQEKFVLIENGKIKHGYSDKRIAKEYSVPNTAAASGSYDDIPSVDNADLIDLRIKLKPSNSKLFELLGDKEAILAILMEGGDCTNEGDFAAPVQMSYLVKQGKIIGRLPEFSVYGNIYEMFGADYIGQSSDKCYFAENAVVVNMNIK